MTDAELDEWGAGERQKVVEYLAQQHGLNHGAVGEWPAWRLATKLSLWAVESVRTPGAIGWWVICGDLPTDYCTGGPDCRIPRAAVRKIVQHWQTALDRSMTVIPKLASWAWTAVSLPSFERASML